MEAACKVCPVCEVKIQGEQVLFSYGKPGDKKKLLLRVCQYSKRPGCINELYDPQDDYSKELSNETLEKYWDYGAGI